MSSMKISAEDGTDITESVQILYDMAHMSMDWGSGMLDNEEMEAVIRLAIHMGWKVPDLPDNSDAMASVARKFPEHYEIVVIEHPAYEILGRSYPARTSERVKVRT